MIETGLTPDNPVRWFFAYEDARREQRQEQQQGGDIQVVD